MVRERRSAGEWLGDRLRNCLTLQFERKLSSSYTLTVHSPLHVSPGARNIFLLSVSDDVLVLLSHTLPHCITMFLARSDRSWLDVWDGAVTFLHGDHCSINSHDGRGTMCAANRDTKKRTSTAFSKTKSSTAPFTHDSISYVERENERQNQTARKAVIVEAWKSDDRSRKLVHPFTWWWRLQRKGLTFILWENENEFVKSETYLINFALSLSLCLCSLFLFFSGCHVISKRKRDKSVFPFLSFITKRMMRRSSSFLFQTGNSDCQPRHLSSSCIFVPLLPLSLADFNFMLVLFPYTTCLSLPLSLSLFTIAGVVVSQENFARPPTLWDLARKWLLVSLHSLPSLTFSLLLLLDRELHKVQDKVKSMSILPVTQDLRRKTENKSPSHPILEK